MSDPSSESNSSLSIESVEQFAFFVYQFANTLSNPPRIFVILSGGVLTHDSGSN